MTVLTVRNRAASTINRVGQDSLGTCRIPAVVAVVAVVDVVAVAMAHSMVNLADSLVNRAN